MQSEHPSDTPNYTTSGEGADGNLGLANADTRAHAPASTAPATATQPARRRRIVQRALQAIAAIVILGALLGGFYTLYTLRNGQGSQGSLPGSVSVSAPATNASQVIVTGTREGAVVALRPSDGQIYWRYNFGGRYPITNIFIQHGAVYAVSGVGNSVQLFALRLSDGHPLWSNRLGNADSYPTFLQVDNGILYTVAGRSAATAASGGSVTSNDMVAVRLSDGAVLWRAPIGSPLFIADGIVYVPAGVPFTHQSVEALQGTTGKVLWQFTPTTYLHFVAAWQGTVYMYSQNHAYSQNNAAPVTAELIGRNERTGAITRRLPTVVEPQPTIGELSDSLSVNGIVYLLAGVRLYAVSLSTGNQEWSVPANPNLGAFSDDMGANRIYLLALTGNNNLEVSAFDTLTGQQLWNSTIGPVKQTSPSNSGGVSINGEIFEQQGITQIGDAVFVAGTPGLITLRASDGHVVRRDLPNDILFAVAQPTP